MPKSLITSFFVGTILLSFVLVSEYALSQPSPSTASGRLLLNTNAERFENLNKFLFVLEDPKGQLTFQDLEKLALDSAFQPFSETKALNKNSVYWGKIEIENRLPSKTNWLLTVAETGTNFIEVFVKKNDTDQVELKKTGEYVSFVDKSQPKKRDCTVFIDVPYQKTTTLFIKIQNIDKRDISFDIYLTSPETYIQARAKKNTIQGLYTSIMLIILIYCLYSFYLNQDKAYLHFGLYSAGISFYFVYEQGLALTTIAKDLPYVQPFILWIAILAIISHFQFIRYFVIQSIFTGKWADTFKWINRLVFSIFGLGMLVLLLLFDFTIIQFLIKFLLVSAILMTAWMMLPILKSEAKGRYYLLAAYGIFTFSIIANGYSALFWDTALSAQILQPGLMASVIILIFGLKYRNKQIEIRQREAQSSLIQQLKESENVRIKLNAELEEKIKERTVKVDQHQREIAMQAKELVEMNWELHEKNEAFQRNNKELEVTNKKLIQKNEELKVLNERLNQALEQLKETQVQLIHSEKMASIGLLTAGIAHEINNPINFVYAGTDTLDSTLKELMLVVEQFGKITEANSPQEIKAFMRDMEELKTELDFEENKEDVFALIADIKEGASRTAEIVRGLRNFSRLDEEQVKLVNIHEGVDSTLALLRNKIKNGVEVIRDFDPNLPAAECFPGQINQVFMNLLVNAVQAISENKALHKTGVIEIKTICKVPAGGEPEEADHIEIHVKDNGGGIPEDLQNRIFEPFFTTKKVGEGTGLGLPITQKIVEKHHGKITVESEIGKGSTFIIVLPVKQAAEVG